MFIPEITTRVTTKVHTDSIDEAINKIESNPYLSQCSSIMETLQNKKNQLKGLEEPVSRAVAERLSSNQETIISTKHYITGKMANSVDISQDGNDYLVGNTAMSVDGFPYPLAIAEGTSSHRVAPVTFSALHWKDKLSGEDRFSKGHTVSGIKPDPFVEPSINTTINDIEDIVSNTIRGIK